MAALILNIQEIEGQMKILPQSHITENHAHILKWAFSAQCGWSAEVFSLIFGGQNNRTHAQSHRSLQLHQLRFTAGLTKEALHSVLFTPV